jgi:hypothetical protein
MAYAECPICSTTTTLVRHHDHFSDLCFRIKWDYRDSAVDYSANLTPNQEQILKPYNDSIDWKTFPDAWICFDCNYYDGQLKRTNKILPWFFSASPEEIYLLMGEEKREREQNSDMTDQMFRFLKQNRELKGETSELLLKIWKHKKKQYVPKIALLREAGIGMDLIKKHWQTKPQGYGNSSADANRKIMLGLYAQTPPEFKELCETPGNELKLGSMIRELGWNYTAMHNFIFWYHKKHNNPNCRYNQFNIGQSDFVTWWHTLCRDGETAPERFLTKKKASYRRWGRSPRQEYERRDAMRETGLTPWELNYAQLLKPFGSKQ